MKQFKHTKQIISAFMVLAAGVAFHAGAETFEDIAVEVDGKTYSYIMTDDYDALCTELATYNCRAPSGGDLRPNPALAQSVRDKMTELGVCWSITASNNSGVLNYYTKNEGPHIVYLQNLKRK